MLRWFLFYLEVYLGIFVWLFVNVELDDGFVFLFELLEFVDFFMNWCFVDDVIVVV